MGAFDWYDTNHDGSLDFAEIDRWQLDNGGYPGQFENDHSTYKDKGSKKSHKSNRSSWDSDNSCKGSSRSSHDWNDDEDDRDDRDNNNDDDDYGNWDNDTISGIDSCTQCLFWTHDDPEFPCTRDCGCGIWGYVAHKCGDEGGGDIVRYDEASGTCEYFEDAIEPRPHCCDCAWWKDPDDTHIPVYFGCRKREKLEKLEEKTDYEFTPPEGNGDETLTLCPYFSER